MPTLGEFSTRLLKRGCTIKSLLLDQSFSAGIGNWLADEILYHSKVHPEQPANSLHDDNIWENITYVCPTAVACSADDSQFPAIGSFLTVGYAICTSLFGG
jgi:formamidopyrimidine-DNA glycosylase